ncbi:recombinase family protein [Streptomyces decoyicus]|uniref:recombinase family protein n=1 Tax=Streptomyces decoyicus TaxID=249567 RepID=UPI0033FEC1CF
MPSPKRAVSGSSPARSPARTPNARNCGKALDYLREGGPLVVPSPDRLGRSVQDLIAIVSGLRKPASASWRPGR